MGPPGAHIINRVGLRFCDWIFPFCDALVHHAASEQAEDGEGEGGGRQNRDRSSSRSRFDPRNRPEIYARKHGFNEAE